MNTNLVLILNQQEFDLDQAITIAGSGPVIEVTPAELWLDDSKFEVRGAAAATREFVNSGSPVFYEIEGRYAVLRGLASIVAKSSTPGDTSNLKIKGRLLSRPALKKARLSSLPEFNQPVSMHETEYPQREYSREDRYQDRPARPYGGRTNTTTGTGSRPRSSYHHSPRG